ncbi:MAG: hypothetical protein IK012_13395 [Fibrobacter sp.]|uniref:hypothetical protein n=1 Tax=Fibrobacter sp. TaxID=35828 RepID=UPI0025BB1E26|nr:hypothetical protein [Fibrobacter sp.]MBR4786226.1 hypothetical protein [Fibrobacter sp.]
MFTRIHKILLFTGVLTGALFSAVPAADKDINKPVSDAEIFRPEKRETRVQLVDSSKSNSIMLNVDIFGSLDVQSYYILWDNVDLSEDLKKMMTTRDFARDEFFMQNIDREQFEQERMLQLFEDRKRDFFAIFPEEALKELQEKEEEDK